MPFTTQVVMIAGPAFSGKTSSSILAAMNLTQAGKPSKQISSGFIYRILGYAARVLEIEDWREHNCETLIAAVRPDTLRIADDGQILWKGTLVPDELLKDQEVSDLTSQIAQDNRVRRASQQLLNGLIKDYDGQFVLIDGRDWDRTIYGGMPVQQLIYVHVSDEVAAKRGGVSVEEVKTRNARDADRLRIARERANAFINSDELSEPQQAQRITRLIFEAAA